MSNQVEPPKHRSDSKLQSVANEIKEILRREDIAASIVLCSGNGHSEYVKNASVIYVTRSETSTRCSKGIAWKGSDVLAQAVQIYHAAMMKLMQLNNAQEMRH